MTTPGLPSDWPGRVAYAEETHRQALALYDYIFPPWRWPEWHRRKREIERRRKVLREVLP